jgi:subtilase family serine protease
MTARVAAGVSALLGVMVLTTAPAAQRGAPAARRGGPPAHAAADRFDVSRALRDLPRLPPRAAGPKHEAPRFRHIIGPQSIDPIVQSSPLPQLLSEPALSFEGIGNVNGVLPPDTNGDVGPGHYVQWVNLAFAIYAKGQPGSAPSLIYGPAAGNTLWTGFGGPCETTNNGDPVVRYDHLADRWVMSQLALPNAFFGLYFAPFYQCIAVSATPDPTGPYYRYQYSFNRLNDYPKFGVWPDAYYMTMNQFAPPLLSFAGQGVIAFDRAKMLLGQPAAMIYFDLSAVDPSLGGMLPSDLDGPPPPAGAPNYFMQVDDDGWGSAQDQLQLWRFHVDWATPSSSSFTHAASLATAPFDSNLCALGENCIPQPGVAARLSPLSDRLMYRLQYRNFGTHESLVVNHTVDVDGSDHAGIRWYEVRDPQGLPSIHQQGSYAPDADHRWMGSAAMDAAGNLAVGFSVSSQTTSPSVRFAGRLAGDPAGMLSQGETTLIAGSGSQTSATGRWGDYSMLSVDPADDCTFWYTQQYYSDTTDAGWRTRIGTFSLPPCVAPSSDLPRVSVTATTSTATEAGPGNGAFTVSRTGDTGAPLPVSYTVGGTATAGADYTVLSGAVTIPAGSASTAIAVVPIDDALTEPNETIVITIGQAPSYLVGASGTAIVTLVSDDTPPDLIVASFTAPPAGGAGAPLALSDTTRNQGSGPSPATVTAFYLSADFILSADDVPIGSRAVPPLAPGASDAGVTTATVPEGTSAGTHFLIVSADAGRTAPETQEGNNTRWTTIAVGPDLIVSAVSVPAAGAAGRPIAVTDTVTNRGGEAAPPSSIGFFLSANSTFDGADLPMGTRAVPALAAGAASSATTTVTVPPGAATGTHFVIGVADPASALAESSENNNVRASGAIRIGADLVVSALTAPSTGGAGRQIVVGDTTLNQGGADAPASRTAFRLSLNQTLDASDIVLGSRSVAALPAAAPGAASTSLTVPPAVATGIYYVIASADADAQIAESVESNNTRASQQVRIGPDLAQSTTTVAPSAAGPGGTIAVGDTARNQGGGDAAPSTTGFYLSTTSVFSPSARPIGTRAVPALAPGTSHTASTPVQLPADLSTGTYFVFARADAPGVLAETSETNNASFGTAVRVGPDLVVPAVSAPSSIAAGASVVVNGTARNQGGGAAEGSTIRFYLSSNVSLDSSDVLVGSRIVRPLAAGETDAGPATIVVPDGTPGGSYTLIAVVDEANAVQETVETNNTRLAFITVAGGARP